MFGGIRSLGTEEVVRIWGGFMVFGLKFSVGFFRRGVLGYFVSVVSLGWSLVWVIVGFVRVIFVGVRFFYRYIFE